MTHSRRIAHDRLHVVGGPRESAWLGYALAIALTVLAIWFRVILTPLLGDQIPFATFFLAVAVTAWFGGAGPCLLAVALGALGAWYFSLSPRHSLALTEPYQVIGLSMYVVGGMIIAAFAQRAVKAMQRADEARRQCEEQLAEAERAKEDIDRYATALQESEWRFRGYAEHTQDVLWIARGDRPELIYVNPSFDRVYGRPPDEVMKDFNRLAEYVHADERHRARTFWQRCGKGAIVEEYRVMRPDGSMAWIRRRGFPIPDEHGNVAYRAGISEDISEEKRIQYERDRLLEGERMAREQAERNNRVKDEFLATLSHELRTPLNAILSWAQVLKGTSVTAEETVQALDAIARNGRSQARLIDELLDMNRIVSGKLRLEVQSIDLAPIVRATVESMVPAAEAKGIRIEQVLDPVVGRVKGDPDRLQQIVWNLLSNAVKFTQPGGHVRVHLQRTGSHCEVSVSDTGRGIPADFLPYVFDRFRQRDASTTRTEAGLGLGLAIVKELVEHQGGSVAAKSDGEGRGATFLVRLPIEAGPSRVADSPPLASGGERDLSLNGVRILVVADDPDDGLALRRILEGHQATVVTAASPAAALSLIERERPDILVSDFGMAGEKGQQFIAGVHALPEPARHTPAIAVTAFGRPEDRVKALMAGYHMHVAKPIDAVELLTVIRHLKRA